MVVSVRRPNGPTNLSGAFDPLSPESALKRASRCIRLEVWNSLGFGKDMSDNGRDFHVCLTEIQVDLMKRLLPAEQGRLLQVRNHLLECPCIKEIGKDAVPLLSQGNTFSQTHGGHPDTERPVHHIATLGLGADDERIDNFVAVSLFFGIQQEMPAGRQQLTGLPVRGFLWLRFGRDGFRRTFAPHCTFTGEQPTGIDVKRADASFQERQFGYRSIEVASDIGLVGSCHPGTDPVLSLTKRIDDFLQAARKCVSFFVFHVSDAPIWVQDSCFPYTLLYMG